jgi:hypothetical protein
MRTIPRFQAAPSQQLFSLAGEVVRTRGVMTWPGLDKPGFNLG